MDPVLLAVLSRRLDAVARKMQHALVRSSRSGVISSGHDCSCCLLTADAELLSAAQTIPIHVMSGADIMARSMADLHADLRAGDAFLHNSPYLGCTHAADLTVLVPVLDDAGRHQFTMLAKAHQADIGNARPTTYMAEAQDLYEEGAVIFPAVRIQRDYQTIDDIVRLGMARISGAAIFWP
jgi:N-methylhydantoinase B